MKLCDRAGQLSHESVVIDGSKFRVVNADNKSYVSSNAKKVIVQRRSWQQDAKIRVAFPIAFYTDLSSMIFYNGFCDGKPKTVATRLPAPGTVNSVKTFKNMS